VTPCKGGFASDEKPQHTLDSAVTHRQCDGSDFALLSGMLRNFASRKYCGFWERSGHSVQLHVAVSAVHRRLKLASQMNGVLTARHHEIGNVEAPLRIDMLQYAFKLVLR